MAGALSINDRETIR